MFNFTETTTLASLSSTTCKSFSDSPYKPSFSKSFDETRCITCATPSFDQIIPGAWFRTHITPSTLVLVTAPSSGTLTSTCNTQYTIKRSPSRTDPHYPWYQNNQGGSKPLADGARRRESTYSIDLPYTKKTSKMGVAQTWIIDPFLLMTKSEVTALSFCRDYTTNLRSSGIVCPTLVKLHKPA